VVAKRIRNFWIVIYTSSHYVQKLCLLSDLRHSWTEYYSQLVTVIRQDDRGTVVGFQAGTRDFFSSPNVHANSWAYPASCSVEARDSFPEDKVGVDCEANHSPPSSAEAKNEWSYAFTLFIRLNGVHGNSFTILNIKGVKLWTGFIWLGVRTNCRM